jgi:hypothetical protein
MLENPDNRELPLLVNQGIIGEDGEVEVHKLKVTG